MMNRKRGLAGPLLALAAICAAIPATAGPAPSAIEKVINSAQYSIAAAPAPNISASAATFQAAIIADTALVPAAILTTDATGDGAMAHGVMAITATDVRSAKEGGAALRAAKLADKDIPSSLAISGTTIGNNTTTGATANHSTTAAALATAQHAVSTQLVCTNGPNPTTAFSSVAESDNRQLLAASPDGAAPELVGALC